MAAALPPMLRLAATSPVRRAARSRSRPLRPARRPRL